VFISVKRTLASSPWLPINVSLPFINNREHSQLGTCLELFLTVLKSLVDRDNVFRGSREGHEHFYSSVYCILKSVLAACKTLEVVYIECTILASCKDAFTRLNSSYTSPVYIEGHPKKQFSEVCFHTHYESRRTIVLDIIYLHHLVPFMRIHKNYQEKNHQFIYLFNLIDFTTFNYFFPSFLSLEESSVNGSLN
jgi:hypothetical protein